MADKIDLDPHARADDPSADAGAAGLHVISRDLAYQRLAIVNVVYIGEPADNNWVLVDTGISGMSHFIISAAEARFGKGATPSAIILTHGHADHIGSLEALLEKWKVPVYAHRLELPYLNGSASYPPPDTTVGGGLMSVMSKLFSRGPINISTVLNRLPDDGTVPHLPDWKWIHVPGHTPGQIALFRESDRALIAADAFVTTKQESVYAVATQKPEMHGPPMYYTQDFSAAEASVRRLANLEPALAITGHGRAMQGPELRDALHLLADNFKEIAVPKNGKYVLHPAHVSDQSAYCPRN